MLDRFITNYNAYLKAVIAEAQDRDYKHVRTFDSYLTLRRETGAVKSCLNLLLLEHEIPGDLLEDSHIARMETLGLDLVCVGNVRAPKIPGGVTDERRRIFCPLTSSTPEAIHTML